MIVKLDHTSHKIAEEIRAVFQLSYAVEAELLNAIDFPPLKRTIDEFLYCENSFDGYFENDDLAAVVEVKHGENLTRIQSLVVRPTYFRQGIGSALIRFVLDTYASKIFIVETGLANEPATGLYKQFGFVETKQWDTDHGVRKIAFELKKLNSTKTVLVGNRIPI